MPSRITDTFKFSAHGMMAGSASAAAFTSVPAKWVKLKAKSDNTGSVWIGNSSAVIKGATSTSAVVGWELDAGQEIDLPVPGGDLANLYYISDTTADDVIYVVYH